MDLKFTAVSSIHPHSVVTTWRWAALVTTRVCIVSPSDDEYNIPEITPCHDVGEALKHIDVVSKKEPADLRPLVRRLVRDASICFYASDHAEMY